MNNNTQNPVLISLSMIEEFLNCLKAQSRSDATLRKYSADLKSFYNFLPEDKLLYCTSVSDWRDHLLSNGFALRTVNTRIAACNSFLNHLDRKSWHVSPISLATEDASLSLTRADYHELLKAARQSNKEWVYFLIKAFCCFGLSVSELHFLTVNSLVSGTITVETDNRTRNIYIPEVLRIEFLNYANRANIHSGSFFKSPSGEVFSRALISKEIRKLCATAGIPRNKITIKRLCNVYYDTYSEIRSSSTSLFDKEYSRILEQEDSIIGWENIAV